MPHGWTPSATLQQQALGDLRVRITKETMPKLSTVVFVILVATTARNDMLVWLHYSSNEKP